MVSMLRSFTLFAVAAGAAVAALGATPAPDGAPVTVAVAGRANANVSIAARETLVVAAWGASRDGAADVYAAVSRDGGRSFGAPVRVNAVPGEAALGGERAPRVAIAPRQGGPAIAVLWTAKAPPARADAPSGVRRRDRSSALPNRPISAARSRLRSISRDATCPGSAVGPRSQPAPTAPGTRRGSMVAPRPPRRRPPDALRLPRRVRQRRAGIITTAARPPLDRCRRCSTAWSVGNSRRTKRSAPRASASAARPRSSGPRRTLAGPAPATWSLPGVTSSRIQSATSR